MTPISNKTPKFFGVFLLAFVNLSLHGQELPKAIVKNDQVSIYDSDLLTKEFHSGRREALRKLMENGSVAVFFSSSLKTRSNDVEYEFHQNPDFYYLTGLNEPNAMLLVFKNDIQYDGFTTNEVLFLKDRNPKTERWDGKLLGTEGATKILGIEHAFTADMLVDFKLDFSTSNKIYLFKQDKLDVDDLEKQFSKKIFLSMEKTDTYSLAEMMEKLREIKTAEEITQMRKAINITCAGIQEAMKAMEPGMHEYDAEAIVEYVFKSKGAEDPGYPSIVGGGDNSCILHYESNRKKLISGDVVVCDVGAEYHGYSADVTRTFPANGKFSEEQKTIYNIVLEAQTAGIFKCKPGEYFRAPHNAAMEIVQKRLQELGIIKTPGEAAKYFFHGTSHYLGLDVHDAGTHGKLMPNSVITVEPGIYIPADSECDKKWWGIGIRIEDDVLITETEPDVLSACVPKTIDEIEAIMKKESLFNLLKK